MCKLLDDSVIVSRAQQVLELGQNILILSWVKFHVLFRFKVLDLEEKF